MPSNSTHLLLSSEFRGAGGSASRIALEVDDDHDSLDVGDPTASSTGSDGPIGEATLLEAENRA